MVCYKQSKSKRQIQPKYETKSIKSSLCDYSDSFILVTGDITVTPNNDTDVAFKIFVPCKTKINDVFVEEASHLHCNTCVNSIENSNNYSEISGSLWKFERDEVPNNNTDFTIDNSQ